MATAEERLAEFLSAKQDEAAFGSSALSRVENENERFRQIMEAYGEPPPPEPEPSFLWKALDTLDTPRQWLAGGIAKATGLEGYSDVGFLEAASRAAEEDLTTADMLRQTDLFSGDDTATTIARAATGFVGDVLLDPVNWVLPLGAAKKIGSTGLKVNTAKTLDAVIDGKTVAQNADQIFKRLQETARIEEGRTVLSRLGMLKEGDDVGKALEKLGKEAPDLLGQIELAASRAAEKPFTQLNVLNEAVKRRSAGLTEAGLNVTEEVAPNVEKIKTALGLTPETTLEDLQGIIKKPRFTLSSPLSGINTFSRVPLLGSREIDVPFLSDVSEQLYKKLGEGYYAAPVKIKNFTDAKAAANPENLFWKSAAVVGKGLVEANDKVVGLFSPVSRRIAASGAILGSSIQADAIKEHELIRGAAANESLREATYLLKSPLSAVGNLPDGGDSVLQDMYRTIQSKVAGGTKYEEALREVQSLYNTKTPGLGDSVVQSIQGTENMFKQLLQKEIDAGLIGGELADRHAKGLLEGYVYQFMKPVGEGMDIPTSDMNDMIRRLVGDLKAPDFTMKRVFETAAHAKARGYKPNEDIFSSVAARLYQHKMLLAEKDFAERFSLQWALPKSTYKKLSDLAFGAASEKQSAAINALRSMGIQLDPTEGLQMMVNGRPFDYEAYTNLKGILTGALPSSPQGLAKAQEDAAAFAKKYMPENPNGFTFDEAEDAYFRGADDALKQRYGLLGREGETVFTRGGATSVPSTMRKKMKNLVGEEATFWDGLLPKHFVQAFEESQSGIKSLQRYSQMMKKSKDPLSQNIGSLLSVADWHRRTMQKLITRPWPAYWVRNMGAAPFQGNVVATMSSLGDALNLPKHLAWRQKLRAGEGLVNEAGETITNSMIQGELKGFNLRGYDNSIADVADNVHDWLLLQSDDARLLKTIPDLAKLRGKELEKAKGLIGKFRVGADKIANGLENFGREAVYVNLRMQGYSPSAAYQEMNKAMVDYARGKTAFESTWLNNIIFFYSFARGNASNMVTALFNKPGALTTQLHGINGAAEALTDRTNYVDDQELEARIATYRGIQGLPKYLGNNPKTGLPMVMGTTGLPIEDAGRLLNILPRNRGASLGDLFTMGGETVKNAMQVVLGQSNPLIKGVVENFISGKSSFFNQPLSAESLRKIASFERIAANVPLAYNNLPEEIWDGMDSGLQAMLGGRKNPDGTITVNQYAMALISALAPVASRVVSTTKAVTDPEKDTGTKLLRTLSGINIQDLDPEKNLAYEQNKLYEEAMTEQGIPLAKKRALTRLRNMQAQESEDANP